MGVPFIGLISGGKDSIYAIHVAVALGHELVGLAHLSPRGGAEETDSWMYQSVGSNVAQTIGRECFPNVPFLTSSVQGIPRETQTLQYYARYEDDEVEDLYRLLGQFGNARGVVTGALLSNYQRERVENVCDRLGLFSIAPLWGWPQLFYIFHLTTFFEDDDAESGFDIRVIKVATEGLNSNHLLLSLKSLKGTLTSLERAINVAGEGGEYESVVLNAPLYQKIIHLKNHKVIVETDETAYAILSVDVQDKEAPEKGRKHIDALSKSLGPNLILADVHISAKHWCALAGFRRTPTTQHVPQLETPQSAEGLINMQLLTPLPRERSWHMFFGDGPRRFRGYVPCRSPGMFAKDVWPLNEEEFIRLDLALTLRNLRWALHQQDKWDELRRVNVKVASGLTKVYQGAIQSLVEHFLQTNWKWIPHGNATAQRWTDAGLLGKYTHHFNPVEEPNDTASKHVKVVVMEDAVPNEGFFTIEGFVPLPEDERGACAEPSVLGR